MIFAGLLVAAEGGAVVKNGGKTAIKGAERRSIKVSVSKQRLYLCRGDKTVKSYPVSTAANGAGSRAGSKQTPLGAHVISDKIGDGAPANTIFVARESTGRIAAIRAAATDPMPKDDLVTSRILWLEGMEEGVNKGPGVDSFKRCIYIHGTADEYAIGRPASHGCIRMKNRDVIELFELVAKGDRVEIVE